MANHPIDDLLLPPPSGEVNRLSFAQEMRQYARGFSGAVLFRTFDLDNVPNALIAGAIFNYDPADIITADDSITCIHDAMGRRFKKAAGGGGGVTDGDKGGITVSGGGTVWTVDAGSITKAMMVAIPTATLMGRDTAGTGAPENLTATEARLLLAYTATLIPITAVGGLSAVNVQAALAELDTDKLATAGGTISGNLTVTGNFVVTGTTFTINSTTATYDDIIMTLGGNIAPVANDSKDRGVEYRWHNGSVAKVGFFGVDRSTGEFVFIPDAVNTAEVISGTVGTIRANLNGNATTATNLVGVSNFKSATITLTDIGGDLDWTQNIVDAAVSPSSFITLRLAPCLDDDENDPELIEYSCLFARPAVGSFDVVMSFKEAHGGPIKLHYQIGV